MIARNSGGSRPGTFATVGGWAAGVVACGDGLEGGSARIGSGGEMLVDSSVSKLILTSWMRVSMPESSDFDSDQKCDAHNITMTAIQKWIIAEAMMARRKPVRLVFAK